LYLIFRNIPNILSFYRLFSFPFLLWIAYSGEEMLFSYLLIVNLITDVADGLIARNFKLQTTFGAKLDSIADFGTFILAIVGIFVFKAEEFEPHLLSFSLFIILFAISHLFSLVKFKQMPSLHLYSWKIGGYIQGAFFGILFIDQFYTPFYYFMLVCSYFSFIEHLIIQIIIKEMKPNAKGLYWVLKDRQK
jgi:cardiolipin synthase